MKNWYVPGLFPEQPGLSTGSVVLEKQNITGNVSYEPENHQLMVKIRQEKVDKIADYIPEQKLTMVLKKERYWCWDGVQHMEPLKVPLLNYWQKDTRYHMRISVMCGHSRKTWEISLKISNPVLIPEINNGQLIKIIRDQYLSMQKAIIRSWASNYKNRNGDEAEGDVRRCE